MTKDTQPRRRVDWDAVERDYRTDTLTLRELAEKHGCSHQAINKRAKSSGWTQDLAKQIKQATNAQLVATLVNQEVAKSGQEVASTVLAAAEVNTRVVLGHRKRIADLHRLAEDAQSKLEAMGCTLVDVREAGVFVQAVNGLASITKTLIEQERKAFGLDDEGAKKKDSVEDLLRELGD